jgi:ParB/RepB/Spo0J family partition protein
LEKPEELPLDRIRTNCDALRDLDARVVADLAKSIQQSGLLQPILVRPDRSWYEVVFGHHRLEACKRLGWQTIPALIKAMSDGDSFLTRLVENLHRNVEINPIAEASGYIRLIDNGWTINKIAQRIGKSDSYVSDRIGLIRRLHPEIAKKFNCADNKYLKPSHLESLARLKSKKEQMELTHMIEQKHLSVRKLERMIAGGYSTRESVEERGDSLYVKLPKAVAEQVSIKAGGSVYVYVQTKRRIAIEPAVGAKAFKDRKADAGPVASNLVQSISRQTRTQNSRRIHNA